MHKLKYRWGKGPRGQYVDEHEQEDVVAYRQNKFLPLFAEQEHTVHRWTNGGPAVPNDCVVPECNTVYWYHDESSFAAHDQRKTYWVADGKKAVLCYGLRR